MKPGLGTEGPLVPGWDLYPQTGGEREEGLLSYPPLAQGSVGGLPLLPPSPKQLPAYLEENQAWNRISLSVFQHLLATEGLTFSEVSMNAGSTNRQSGRSSGSCGKEILLLPDEEVLSGELVRGEERQRSICAGAVAACLPAAEPSEGSLRSSSLLEDGLRCAVAAEDRVELSLAACSAGRATFRVTSQVSPAGTAGFNSSKWRSGKCRCSRSPLSAPSLTRRLRVVFVTIVCRWRGAGRQQVASAFTSGGLAERVPEASGILRCLRCYRGTRRSRRKAGCGGLRAREKTGRGRAAWGLRGGAWGPRGGDGCHCATSARCTQWVQTRRPRWLRLPCQQRFCLRWVWQHALTTKGPVPKVGTAAVSRQGGQRTLRRGLGMSLLTRSNNLPLNILG